MNRDVHLPPLQDPRIIETATRAPLRFVRATVSVEGARPGPFLRLNAGGARGFWARGDEWVAHAGVLARIPVTAPGAGRFVEVREAARACLPVFEPGGERTEPIAPAELRFYGGFAFRDDHVASDVWEGFPPALFQLPRLEMMGRIGGDARLTIRASLEEGADFAEALDAVEAEAAHMAGLLADPAPGQLQDTARDAVPARIVATDRPGWERAVEETLEAIGSGRIAKAVLARTLDVVPAGPVDPVDVVLALWAQSRGAHAFLFEPGVGRSVVGAAPETVATLRAGSFHATAVAGSIRRGDTDEEQGELARRLLASGKDRAEQRVVVEDMVRRLAPLAGEIEVQDEPHVLTLARIQHLETEIRARVGEERHVLDLVEALHPTPAVCGVPRDAALAFLEEEEPFERGWYAGPVGWFDGGGSGVFVPALRTAVVQGGAWRLFAGAGIVSGSDPASEWEETAIKFEPVLRALDSVGVRT